MATSFQFRGYRRLSALSIFRFHVSSTSSFNKNHNVRNYNSQIKLTDIHSEDNNILGEDLRYLKQQYQNLLPTDGVSKLLSNKKFMKWEEIQAILVDGACTKEEVDSIWVAKAGSLTKDIDFDIFVSINREIDELFEFIDESEVEENGNRDIDIEEVIEEVVEEGVISELDDLDIWDDSIEPEKVLGKEIVEYLKKFFNENSNEKDLLQYKTFADWIDVQELLKKGQVDLSCLRDLWREAVQQRKEESPDDLMAISPKISGGSTDLNCLINYDTFLRMYIRLDIVLEEIEEALKNLTDSDVEEFYRSEYENLTNAGATGEEGKSLLSLAQLLEWSELVEMLNNKDITKEQIQNLWNALPKEPFVSKKNKGFGMAKEGITVEAFLMLNNEIEDIIYGNLEEN